VDNELFMKLRLAGIVKESVVDGSGLRYVIFTQGCPHRCVGCHNPHTQDLAGGYDMSIADLLNSILDTKLISGITFSGGEPFIQATACAELAKLVKEHRKELNIVAYSGYYYTELLAMAKKDKAISEFLHSIDILIDGPYDIEQKAYDLPYRGSKNQNIIDSTHNPQRPKIAF
jgi:anaerobic ribonucleoside-triphosphate reductase activating protein